MRGGWECIVIDRGRLPGRGGGASREGWGWVDPRGEDARKSKSHPGAIPGNLVSNDLSAANQITDAIR